MKNILVLGGGTAGTMVVNKLHKKLNKLDWQITIVDQDDKHLYQPGLLLMPFKVYEPDQLVKSRQSFIPDSVTFIQAEIENVDVTANCVVLKDSRILPYDYLIIATGTTPRPDQTSGMEDPKIWRKSVFDFFTLEGSLALRDALDSWEGGSLVVQICEMPIKCPVAPLEFAFLADAYFEKKKMREKVQITYVTPLEGAFTKPVCSKQLGYMLDEREIKLEPDYMIDRIDPDTKIMYSMDEREIPFDLLVTVPVNMGADFIAKSSLGDELNYVPVDKNTFLSKKHSNVFALGDASDIPASKAGSVAHFAIELFAENFVNYVAGKEMTHLFDGHANCFIESGNGKGLLIDFNYATEPLRGKFPLPFIGPFPLLKEGRINHLGKLAFRWIYWHLLIKARKIPVPALMSMAGKEVSESK